MKRFLWPATMAPLLLFAAFQFGLSQGRRPAAEGLEEAKSEAWLAKLKRELAERKPSLETLALEKRTAARQSFESRFDEFATGRVITCDFLLLSLRELRDAELAVCKTDAERLEVQERLWAYAKWADLHNQAKFQAGTIGPANYYPVLTTRLQFEYDLVKARGK